MTLLKLVAAYGRKYDSVEAAVLDWKAGKDFRIINGPYCSIRDIKFIRADGYDSITIGLTNGFVKISLY